MSVEIGFDESKIITRIERFNKHLSVMNVANDIDNTDVATNAGGLVIVNKRYGTNFQLADLKYDFAIVDLLAEHVPSIQDPLEEAITIWNSDENVCNARPMSGALIISKYLSDSGINQIHRITQRPARLKDQTLEWYQTRMPWVDRSLIHIQPKGKDYDKFFKIDRVKDLKIDLIFEDSIPQAETIDAQTSAITALIPQDSNKGYKPGPGSRIIVVPDSYYPSHPAFVRAYLYTADVLT